MPRTKTDARSVLEALSVLVPAPAWNAFPVPLRESELSLDSFKRKLESHFFTSYILVIVLFFINNLSHRARLRDL